MKTLIKNIIYSNCAFGSLLIPKQGPELLLWCTCPERSIDHILHKVFASFLCVLSWSLVLGRFIHLYFDTSSLGRNTPVWRVKPLLFSHIPNIFSVYILSKTVKIPILIAFYKLLLSDIKVKILINSWHFLIVFFLMCTQFSVNERCKGGTHSGKVISDL